MAEEEEVRIRGAFNNRFTLVIPKIKSELRGVAVRPVCKIEIRLAT